VHTNSNGFDNRPKDADQQSFVTPFDFPPGKLVDDISVPPNVREKIWGIKIVTDVF
jgi:hypothetical protein